MGRTAPRPRPRTALLLLRALRRPVVDLVVVLPALVPQTWPAGHRALHYRIIADGDDDELVVSYVVLELEYSTTIDIALISIESRITRVLECNTQVHFSTYL